MKLCLSHFMPFFLPSFLFFPNFSPVMSLQLLKQASSGHQRKCLWLWASALASPTVAGVVVLVKWCVLQGRCPIKNGLNSTNRTIFFLPAGLFLLSLGFCASWFMFTLAHLPRLPSQERWGSCVERCTNRRHGAADGAAVLQARRSAEWRQSAQQRRFHLSVYITLITTLRFSQLTHKRSVYTLTVHLLRLVAFPHMLLLDSNWWNCTWLRRYPETHMHIYMYIYKRASRNTHSEFNINCFIAS